MSSEKENGLVKHDLPLVNHLVILHAAGSSNMFPGIQLTQPPVPVGQQVMTWAAFKNKGEKWVLLGQAQPEPG